MKRICQAGLLGESQVGLVNEGGGLQGMPSPLILHVKTGQTVKFFVYERE